MKLHCLIKKQSIRQVLLLLLLNIGVFVAEAQINSPYSRYGIGDLFNNSNAITQGMGGMSLTYIGAQGINFSNPASYSFLSGLNVDVGFNLDLRTLYGKNPDGSFKSNYFSPYYINLAFPLSTKHNIVMTAGFRPVSKIGYSISKISYLPSTGDSVLNVYEGTGGLNQAYLGLAKRWKNGISIGLNAGFFFGKRNANTQVIFLDTDYYYKSSSQENLNYKGLYLEAGALYNLKLIQKTNAQYGSKETYNMQFAGTVQVGQNLSATQESFRGTFDYNSSGAPVYIDTVSYTQQSGYVYLPFQYKFGLGFNKFVNSNYFNTQAWAIGLQYEFADWRNFTVLKQPDLLSNSWTVRFGGELLPDPYFVSKNYLSRITYRLGFYYSNYYINADQAQLKNVAGTIGLGFPFRKPNYSNQFTSLNVSFEYGRLGSQVNSVTENFFRILFGLSLSDLWFIKRKYY